MNSFRRWKIAALLFGLILALIFSFQNCGESPRARLINGGPATVEVQNSVLIDCRVVDPQGRTVQRLRSYAGSSPVLQSLAEDTPYLIDCSQSRMSDGSTADLSVDAVESTAGHFTTQSDGLQVQFDDPGQHQVVLHAQNLETGQDQTSTFSLDVRCTEESGLNVSGATIQISPTSTQGYYRFSILGVSGGQGPYQYLWDFNGDGRVDMHRTPQGWQHWSSASQVENVATHFAGTRSVAVYVKDSCQIPKLVQQSYNFQIPQVSSPEVDPAYTYYVQAQIRPLLPTDDRKWNQVDYAARQPAQTPDQKVRLSCSYPKVNTGQHRVLNVQAHNAYDPNAGGPAMHGLSFQITNIQDGGEMGIVNLGTERGRVGSARYRVAEVGDVELGYSLAQVGSCDLAFFEIERRIGASFCQGDPTTPTKVVRMRGTLSCPLLRASGGQEVEVRNLHFYCEAGDLQHCVGGPGGSDTGNPIPGR